MGLPPGFGFGAGLFEVNVLVDVIDPGERNEMVLTLRIGVGFGQFQLISTFEMVHGAHMYAVGTENLHVLLDHHRCDHLLLHCLDEQLGARVSGSWVPERLRQSCA